MARNFSDLIQRVTASCLLDPLSAFHREDKLVTTTTPPSLHSHSPSPSTDSEAENGLSLSLSKPESRMEGMLLDMEVLLNEVFDSVSLMKRAYVRLQDSHCPWDPDKMRLADCAVLSELKRLGVLRERYRRTILLNAGFPNAIATGGSRSMPGMGIREVAAPYEAVVDELKRQVKARDVELDNLKEMLRAATPNDIGSGTGAGGNVNKGRSQSRSRSKNKLTQVVAAPTPELFEATMSQVNEASKAFTSLLLSLMRSAHLDISATIRSIQATSAPGNAPNTCSSFGNRQAKHALESYIFHKIFLGFDHETFYMDGSLSSLLNPEQYRQECFTQYRDMKAMDPVELLGILPSCQFGQFCLKKYLSIVSSKMEESLFGNLDQQNQVIHGNHPRSQFYRMFLGMAKAVWLLHLLSFSLDPSPTQFEASRGAEFHAQYMDSVVKFSDGKVPAGHIVGFPVSPGFKFGSGSVIRAKVYLVSRS